MNRAGVLSFANLPLLLLFAGRNNILLWLTNWSHSTFLLLHRWVAVICTLQACLHSAMYLQVYKNNADRDYTSESQLPYWYWGIIATLSFTLLMPLSVFWIRQRFYEAFLASHIVLSILALIGCLLHIIFRFQTQWGYENWIYTGFAVWGFERLLARPIRLLRNGLKTAHISVIDEDYLKVQVPGLVCEGHIYLYFPMLTWRVWENHPFSVAAMRTQTIDSTAFQNMPGSDLENTSSNEANIEKDQSSTVTTGQPIAYGTTFFVRVSGGLTNKFVQATRSSKPIKVLVESSYGHEHTAIYSDPTKASIQYPNLLLIAGGVGITALLSLLDESQTLLAPVGKTKLYWGMRSKALAEEVESLFGSQRPAVGQSRWGSVHVQTSIGKRFDFKLILEEELRNNVGETTIVVSGPVEMVEDVRAIVTRLARQGIVAKFVVESFSW